MLTTNQICVRYQLIFTQSTNRTYRTLFRASIKMVASLQQDCRLQFQATSEIPITNLNATTALGFVLDGGMLEHESVRLSWASWRKRHGTVILEGPCQLKMAAKPINEVNDMK